jgi:hypothetical protein
LLIVEIREINEIADKRDEIEIIEEQCQEVGMLWREMMK